MVCSNCGNRIRKGNSFCSFCGCEVTQHSFGGYASGFKIRKICLSVIAAILTFSMIFGIVAQSVSLNNDTVEVGKKVLFDLNYRKSDNFYKSADFNTNLVAEPIIPQRDGFQFVGWYTSVGYSPMFDFSKEITEDMTLYAKWNDVSDTVDTDKDGLSDSLEKSLGTNPNKWDSDGDTLSDYFELNYLNYNPWKQDSDENGVSDADEDADGDGLSNGEEMRLGTSPILEDSDMDRISDYNEVYKYATNPANSDSDKDGASDGVEIELGYNPLVKDSVFVTTVSCGELTQDTPISVEVTTKSEGKNAGSLSICEKDMSENRHMIDRSSNAYAGPAYDISMDGDFVAASMIFSYDSSLISQHPNFKPCLYWFNETENRYEEVPNQVIDEGKIVAEVSHFSVYQVLDKNELEDVNVNDIDFDKYSKYSATKDSNNDGISDLHTALINDGIIRYNGSKFLFDVEDMYGTESCDWDGDGLKNGEEIRVIDKNGILSIDIISNPLLTDSDGDGFDDSEEICNLKSDPLKYTKNGYGSLSQLKNAYTYDVSWQDNVARFFEFDEQGTVEKLLEDYFYDYSPVNSVANNAEKIDSLTNIGDGIETATQLANVVSDVFDVYDMLSTDYSKADYDSSKLEEDDKARFGLTGEKLSEARKTLNNNRKSIIEEINEKNFRSVVKTGLSASKYIDGLQEFLDSSISGDTTDLEEINQSVSLLKMTCKVTTTAIKIKKLNSARRLLANSEYQKFYKRTSSSSKSVASYVLTMVVDGLEGAADLNEAITSYSKIEANVDAFNNSLVILNDLSNTERLNSCYRRAAKNVMESVLNSSADYMNKISKLHLKQVFITGGNIALDTLSLFNAYAAICKGFLSGVKLIGLNNMAECSIHMEIMNEMQLQCVNELDKLNIVFDDNGNGSTFTYESDDVRASAELLMTNLAQSKILFEYYTFKYNYESGCTSTLASITGGVSKEQGEKSTKNLIKTVYDNINVLQLGVSPNLPYYDDFYDKGILSTLNLKDTSDERDVVLVIDASTSMNGEKLEKTKKAASNFVDTVMNTDSCISVVSYCESAALCDDFSFDKNEIKNSINSISADGNTNIEEGLKLANEQLYYSHAERKIIVLMSDGEPNRGKVGDELADFANTIKDSGIIIYALGFFDNSSEKAKGQPLMERLASEGCHYEVSDSENLVFFFDDIANMISGQQYIYVKIACPVDVFVDFNGETLSSDNDYSEQRAAFGTLIKTKGSAGEEEKILRLNAENKYNIHILGTDSGTMDYLVALMDEKGNFDDFRLFENVKILKGTNISSTVNIGDSTQMTVDEDGDGKTDFTLVAGRNQMGREKNYTYVYLAAFSAMFLGVILSVIIIVCTKRKREVLGVINA